MLWKRRSWLALVLVISAIGLWNGISFAQSSPQATATSGFDLTPILVALVNQSFAVILAIGTYLINAKVKDQQLRDMLSKALTNAIGVVKGQAEKAIKSSNTIVTTTDNADINAGVQYVLNNAAEAVSHFNIQEAKIAEKIIARIGLLDAGVKPS